MKVPKLRHENLFAAHAVVAFLIENPGTIQKDLYIFINSRKSCLKQFNKPMLNTNYENIKSYLFSKGLIMSRQDKRNVRYYATI